MKAILAAAVLLPGLALAQIAGNQTIGYQGRLLQADGKPVQGPVSVTFTIYDKGGAVKWAEQQTVTPNLQGFYAVFLGSVNVFQADLFNGSDDRWLGIKVGSDRELTPRQKIGAVAYAIQATHAVSADAAANAIHADSATHATSAASADTATRANSADSTDSARAAGTATNVYGGGAVNAASGYFSDNVTVAGSLAVGALSGRLLGSATCNTLSGAAYAWGTAGCNGGTPVCSGGTVRITSVVTNSGIISSTATGFMCVQ